MPELPWARSELKGAASDGVIIDDLPTPSVLVERRRFEANLRRMQEKADLNRVTLRPHAKTHKSVSISRRQQELGARGITVATVQEAEIFAAGGFQDICIAYTVVDRGELERIAALRSSARVSFCIDTPTGARIASSVFAEAAAEADVLVEIDVGFRRTGVAWDSPDVVELARLISSLPALRLTGVLTHAGQGYHAPESGETADEALLRRSTEERDRILVSASRLRQAGLIDPSSGFTISIGSTPTMAAFENVERDGLRVTEIRPGNYVFNDVIQVALGAASLADCALTVLATVVSKHRDRDGSERVYIDAGKKVLTSDTGAGTNGYGIVLYNASTMTPLPHASIYALSEEHGWLRFHGGSTLSVGDRIRIVPNHACVVVATRPVLHVVDGDDVVESIRVDAR